MRWGTIKIKRKFGANERRSLYGFITAAIPLVGYLVFNIVPLDW